MAMVPWLKFLISFAFLGLGIAVFLIRLDAVGFAAFLLISGIGSMISTWVFKNHATAEQIREDLDARLDSD
ncbi:hypothetical protein HFP57_06595 [Parasphingopyxis algicola]|uniref:hypothetical protein n=1 Tax=Parasphingopyxis algicola TaxID=2026624 RepID=UPI0015A05625|nr:hypothetical protein [Parasphingopyxis algicola]QLC24729.1 hypothetical protein HFP57_06595 [Parasphingopyxis algicola]